MVELTVGQVSAIIAAAVFIVQHVLPNAVILILVGVLRNEHTAVTWSRVQRDLLSSLWPTWLRTDSSAGRGVSVPVRLVSILRPIGLLLVALSAVVTPLGLYDAVLPSEDSVSVPFEPLTDNTPMGLGTPPRSTKGFTRSCGNFGPLPCPDSKSVVDITRDDDGSVLDAEVIGSYDMQVPESLIDLYQSGLSHQPETVSSFFDIQSRQYTFLSDPDKDNGDPYLVSSFRMLDSIILHDTIEPVEGLIVDTKNGGIGFRHHTIPRGVGQAAEWDEDLLFIEPMTSCVDTNLTIEFRIPEDGILGSGSMGNLTLIDNGGFINIDQDFPTMNRDDNMINPKLELRAYRSAWLTNTFAMLVMNVTRPNPDAFGYLNSELGKRFPLSAPFGTVSANSIVVDGTFSKLVSPEDNTIGNSSSSTGSYENPFQITADNLTDITTLCQGAGGADLANGTNIQVECGLVFTAARPVSGEDTLIFKPGDVYQQSVFSCASVNKASIKTVSFRYNATFGANLNALMVRDVVDKTYDSNESMPLWGIESPKPNFQLTELTQLWGLISPESPLASSPSISTIRAPQLYLPGFSLSGTLTAGFPSFQYVPGTTGPRDALGAVYASTGDSISAFDWSGQSNLALYQKWQQLSRNETTVAKMLGLIWTDAAANLMTGTRGWDANSTTSNNLAKRQTQGGSNGSGPGELVPVKVFRRQVQYRWLYAIPAFAALLVFLGITCLATCCSLFRSGPRRVRFYIDHLSAGRLLAEQQYPGRISKAAPTKQWLHTMGKEKVDIQGTQPQGGRLGGSPFVGPEKTGPTVYATPVVGNAIPLSPLNHDGRVYGNGYVRMQDNHIGGQYAR